VTGIGFQSLFAVLVVLALVAAMAWLVRRGAFGALRGGSRAIVVETAVPIGERRSLIIVAVEGRRLLLGLTPGQIAMVTELGPAPSFDQQLADRTRGGVTPSGPQVSSGSITPRTIFGGILKLSGHDAPPRTAERIGGPSLPDARPPRWPRLRQLLRPTIGNASSATALVVGDVS
jgi:flagellar biosynthetic protein FliO